MRASRTTRRQLIQRSGASLGALMIPGALAACGSSGSGGGAAGGDGLGSSVVFADFGGSTRDAREKAVFEKFSSDKGVRVIPADADLAQFKVMAQRGRPQWDAIDANGITGVQMAKAGLLEKLPASVTQSDFVPEKWRSYFTAGYANCHNLAYNKSAMRTAPEGWADFFDLKRFPGRRGLPSIFLGPSVFEAALLADGVPVDQLLPVDYERAQHKLDSIRDKVVFYGEIAAGQQALVQGSVGMSVLPSGRVFALKQAGEPVEMVWNEAFLYPWSGSLVPKTPPHPKAIFALLNAMMEPRAQAEFSKLTGNGPATKKAFDYLDDKTLKDLPNSPEHMQVVVPLDVERYAQIFDDYSKRYLAWVGG